MASVPLTQEDGQTPGQFTVWRTGSTESALAIGYSVSGTATGGTDYQALSGTVTIPAGQSSQSFDVVPIDDAVFEGKESVVATLQFGGSYRLSLAREAMVTIVEDDPSPPVISVSDPTVTEGGTLQFTLTLSPGSSRAVTIQYTTANDGVRKKSTSAIIVGPVLSEKHYNVFQTGPGAVIGHKVIQGAHIVGATNDNVDEPGGLYSPSLDITHSNKTVHVLENGVWVAYSTGIAEQSAV